MVSIYHVGLGIGISGLIIAQRRLIWRKTKYMVDQVLGTYINLKWKYLGEPDIGSNINQGQSDVRCTVVTREDDYILYQYKDGFYLTTDNEPPIINDIDMSYDSTERISEIIINGKDGEIMSDSDDNAAKIDDVLRLLAGPLCDLSNVTIDTLKILDASIDTFNIEKIIVNTEHMHEYILC